MLGRLTVRMPYPLPVMIFTCLLLVMIPSAVISAGLIFGMFGATSVGGVTAFAIFYGFFTGGCMLYSLSPQIQKADVHTPKWYR